MTRRLPRRAVLGLTAAGLTTGCLRLSQQEEDAEPTTEPADSGSDGGDQTTESGGSDTTQGESGDGGDTDVEYPAGVEDDGVAASVAIEHRAQIANQSVTVTETQVREFGTTSERAEIGNEGTLLTRSDPGGTVESWLAGGATYSRADIRGSTVYAYVEDGARGRENYTKVDVLRLLIETGNYRPTGTETADGTTYIVIAADAAETDALARREGGSEVTSFEGEGRITTDGVIRSLSATYEISGPETQSGQLTVETTDIGSTNPGEPDWTSTARERAPRFSVLTVDDGQFVRVEHTGGDGVPTANVGLYQPIQGGDSFFGRVENGIAPGDVLYVYKADTDGGAGIEKNSKPSVSSEPFSGEYNVDVYAQSLQLFQGRVSV
jgi:hypothetical protein